MPTEPAATDAEIAATAMRLGLNRRPSGPAHRKPTARHIYQSLPHGHSNVVVVEIKHSARLLGGVQSRSNAIGRRVPKV
jgi:hypothetical protein